MEVMRAGKTHYKKGGSDRFIGDVWLGSGIATPDRTSASVVRFAPGARTHWHRHPGGQILYVVSGAGRVRSRGGTGEILRPGDVVYIAADEWHFHGGAPDSPIVHLAVNPGGGPEWSEPVTDDEYGEGFPS